MSTSLSVVPTAPIAQSQHPVLGDPNLLGEILSHLPGEEIAKTRKVARLFNAVSHSVTPLREEVNFAKYKKIGAEERYFSGPRGSHHGGEWKILTHKDIFRLAERLQNRGNHQTDLSQVLGRNFTYTQLDDIRYVKHRPTDIIKMIPDKEIGRVYYHLWQMLGNPPGANAGKDAFYDKNGLHSTPAQKAAALMAFLREKAQVEPTGTELNSVIRIP